MGTALLASSVVWGNDLCCLACRDHLVREDICGWAKHFLETCFTYQFGVLVRWIAARKDSDDKQSRISPQFGTGVSWFDLGSAQFASHLIPIIWSTRGWSYSPMVGTYTCWEQVSGFDSTKILPLINWMETLLASCWIIIAQLIARTVHILWFDNEIMARPWSHPRSSSACPFAVQTNAFTLFAD